MDNVCATFSTIAWSGGKIVIKEGSGAVVGTGAVVSGSAKTFLEYLQTQSIAGTVLELGSGTGAVGIGVAVQGCSVVATDVVTNPHGCPIRALEAAAQDVRSEEIKHATGSFANLLEVIERNATMNNESIQRAGGNFRVSPLLWGDTLQLESILEQQPNGFDFIVGCNITYQVPSYQILMDVILGASRPHTRTLVATTSILGDNQELVRVAEANGIHVQPVFQDSTTIVYELY
jgi:ribosomal protein L11 methylase PrmA